MRFAPDVAGEMLSARSQEARWITFWERLWPPLAAIATAIGLFLAVSWAGAWLWLPPIARAVALFVFLVLTAAATVPLIFVRFPSRADGLRRLDRMAGLAHRPATAIADELATSKSRSVVGGVVARPCGARAAGGQDPQGGTAGTAPRPA